MFGLGSKQILTVKPDSALCKNMYHKNAGCTSCTDVCPAEAINIGRPGTGVAIYEDRCSGCGLCISACPQGVFKRAGQSELDWCKSIQDKAVDGKIIIVCGKEQSGKDIKVECIGSIHALHLLQWISDGIQQIVLKHNCDMCELKFGMDCISSQLNSLRALCLSIDGCSIDIKSGTETEITVNSFPFIAPREQVKLNRRELFRFFGREMASGVLNTVDVFTDQNREKIDFVSKHVSGRKRLYEQLKKRCGIDDNSLCLKDNNIPAGKPSFTMENCSRCGLCVKLCPVGAINTDLNKYPKPCSDDCTGCGVCVKACLQKCITLD